MAIEMTGGKSRRPGAGKWRSLQSSSTNERTRDSRAHAGATLAAAATLLSTGGAGMWGAVAKVNLARRLFALARRYPVPALCIGAVVVALWASTHHAHRRDLRPG